jgi:hypothetical protein
MLASAEKMVTSPLMFTPCETSRSHGVGMSAFRHTFLGFVLSRHSKGTEMTKKNDVRVTVDGVQRLRVPGAGEVRVDLKNLTEASLKNASDVLSGRYKLTGTKPDRKR